MFFFLLMAEGFWGWGHGETVRCGANRQDSMRAACFHATLLLRVSAVFFFPVLDWVTMFVYVLRERKAVWCLHRICAYISGACMKMRAPYSCTHTPHTYTHTPRTHTLHTHKPHTHTHAHTHTHTHTGDWVVGLGSRERYCRSCVS